MNPNPIFTGQDGQIWKVSQTVTQLARLTRAGCDASQADGHAMHPSSQKRAFTWAASVQTAGSDALAGLEGSYPSVDAPQRRRTSPATLRSRTLHIRVHVGGYFESTFCPSRVLQLEFREIRTSVGMTSDTWNNSNLNPLLGVEIMLLLRRRTARMTPGTPLRQ